MSDITDNNLTINPGTGGAVVATDYVDSSHFQVMKLAFGNSGDAVRVETGVGLPVDLQDASVNAVLTSVNSGVGIDVRNNIGIYGVAGATLVGVTATDLDIRSLTFGSDSISVLNTVGVTATDLDIRSLTFTTDSVSVLNTVGVTATDLDIRSLTFGSDSVSVLNDVNVLSKTSPFVDGIATGMATRLLRATTGGTPSPVPALVQSATSSNAEDTVRVVGLSGSYPVDVVFMGLTGAGRETRRPVALDSTGAVYVNLVTGSVGVTAIVDSIEYLKIDGLSFGTDLPTSRSQVMPVHGYTGDDMVAITITGADLDIRSLNAATDSVTAVIRVLGASGDYVAITGDPGTNLGKLSFVTFGNNNALQVTDSGLGVVTSNQAAQTAFINTISSNLSNVISNNQLKVNIEAIAQPTGGTCGALAVTTGSTNLGTSTLQSGIHFRSKLENTGVIFIGFNSQVTSGVGFPLYNGDQIFIETDNLNKIFVSSDTAGSTLYFIGT